MSQTPSQHLSPPMPRCPQSGADGSAVQRADVPVGSTPTVIRSWFDETMHGCALTEPGSIEAAREAARDYASQSKSVNTLRAYRAAARIWCDWCETHGLPSLPGSGADVAAFLAEGRDKGASPTTLDLRRAAIRHLHRLAGCPVPTDDACVAEALAGIRRQAGRCGERPRKKKAATPAVLARRAIMIVSTRNDVPFPAHIN